MIEDIGRVPLEPGSHPSGHAASSVDGATRFDPSRTEGTNARSITTGAELRGFLADVLIGIQSGQVKVEQANAIAKVSAQINQSLAIEVNTTLRLKAMGVAPSEAIAAPESDVWCEQCDMRVSRETARTCKSKFCKAKGS